MEYAGWMNGHRRLETFGSGFRRWRWPVGLVVWVLVGCGGKATDGVVEPPGDGDGDVEPPGDGDGDFALIGDGDGGPIGDGDGEGDSGPIGDGDGDGGIFSGRLTSSDGTWDGYTFVTSSENSAVVMPTEFTGSGLCVNGILGGGYEEWALFGWNIAQVLDPVTGEGGAIRAIAPGGTGVNVQVTNNGGSGLRVQIQGDAEASEFWCAALPAVGGTIPWGSFTKECWAPGGEVYDGVTPIAVVGVLTYAGSDTIPTVIDFCVQHIGPG